MDNLIKSVGISFMELVEISLFINGYVITIIIIILKIFNYSFINGYVLYLKILNTYRIFKYFKLPIVFGKIFMLLSFAILFINKYIVIN